MSGFTVVLVSDNMNHIKQYKTEWITELFLHRFLFNLSPA